MAPKGTFLSALRDWVNQRPGLDPRNYGDATTYRSEGRRITQQRQDAHTLLYVAASMPNCTYYVLLDATRAFSGRLQWHEDTQSFTYTTGQYWPTEYRAAACAVLAEALWYAFRETGADDPKALLRKHLPQGTFNRWFK